MCDQGELDTWEGLEGRVSPAEELEVEEPPSIFHGPCGWLFSTAVFNSKSEAIQTSMGTVVF